MRERNILIGKVSLVLREYLLPGIEIFLRRVTELGLPDISSVIGFCHFVRYGSRSGSGNHPERWVVFVPLANQLQEAEPIIEIGLIVRQGQRQLLFGMRVLVPVRNIKIVGLHPADGGIRHPFRRPKPWEDEKLYPFAGLVGGGKDFVDSAPVGRLILVLFDVLPIDLKGDAADALIENWFPTSSCATGLALESSLRICIASPVGAAEAPLGTVRVSSSSRVDPNLPAGVAGSDGTILLLQVILVSSNRPLKVMAGFSLGCCLTIHENRAKPRCFF